ncbi:MAG: hypothetical protein PF689_02665, partial [Deltaproteobacteria bacterium]|nr:hypothetical protein [Deltaproteobacteria bacterium]
MLISNLLIPARLPRSQVQKWRGGWLGRRTKSKATSLPSSWNGMTSKEKIKKEKLIKTIVKKYKLLRTSLNGKKILKNIRQIKWGN